MTGERHAAFKMARDYIAGVAPAKLFENERELLDNAAEDLLLASTFDEARTAQQAAGALLDALVQSDRWTATMRDQLLTLLSDCGPQPQLIGA